MTVAFSKLMVLSRARAGLLLEAAGWLVTARIALAVVPFPRIARYIGQLQSPSSEPEALQTALTVQAAQVGWAVNKAGDHLPGGMVCLPRAVAAWQMLHRRGIASRLHFGAPIRRSESTQFETHAWLSSSGIEVTGYPVAHGCVELGFFAREPLQEGPAPAVTSRW